MRAGNQATVIIPSTNGSLSESWRWCCVNVEASQFPQLTLVNHEKMYLYQYKKGERGADPTNHLYQYKKGERGADPTNHSH
jgi:hypothetical protein